MIPLLSISQEKQYGLTMGLNFGKWMGDDDDFAQGLSDEMNYQEGFSGFSFDSKSRTGFSMGFFYDFPVKKSLSIQPEISYSQKGAKFTGDGMFSYYGEYYNVKSDMVMRLDYLDVLVLAKYSLTNESDIKPYFVAGLGAGYLVSSKMKVKVSVDGESDSETTDIEDCQKMDAHLNFGVGIDFSKALRIDARYGLGLSSIFQDESYKLKNGVISVGLAACF